MQRTEMIGLAPQRACGKYRGPQKASVRTGPCRATSDFGESGRSKPGHAGLGAAAGGRRGETKKFHTSNGGSSITRGRLAAPAFLTTGSRTRPIRFRILSWAETSHGSFQKKPNAVI